MRKRAFNKTIESINKGLLSQTDSYLDRTFVDDVGTVGLVAVVMAFGVEEGEVARLAELGGERVTSLRLLLRCQLSRPRLERG